MTWNGEEIDFVEYGSLYYATLRGYDNINSEENKDWRLGIGRSQSLALCHLIQQLYDFHE